MKEIISPMCAKDSTEVEHKDGKVTVSSKYFDKPNWIGEIKFDGSRYILQRDDEGKAYLTSRTFSVKDNLPVDKTENLRGYLFDDNATMAGTVLDGEILVKIKGEFVKNNGSSEVNKIMLSDPAKAKDRLTNPDIELVYVVYDILKVFGKDIQKQPLNIRKSILEEVMITFDKVLNQYSKKVILSLPVKHNQETYEKILAEGYEGMMIKDLNSPYCQGEHSKYRQKVKKQFTEDGVIVGGQRGTGKYSNTLGALSVAQYFPDGELKEVATISGMTDELRNNYWERLNEQFANGDAGIDKDGNINLDKDFVETKTKVVEFIVQEKTKGKYRHPRYLQERGDKAIKECRF